MTLITIVFLGTEYSIHSLSYRQYVLLSEEEKPKVLFSEDIKLKEQGLWGIYCSPYTKNKCASYLGVAPLEPKILWTK